MTRNICVSFNIPTHTLLACLPQFVDCIKRKLLDGHSLDWHRHYDLFLSFHRRGSNRNNSIDHCSMKSSKKNYLILFDLCIQRIIFVSIENEWKNIKSSVKNAFVNRKLWEKLHHDSFCRYFVSYSFASIELWMNNFSLNSSKKRITYGWTVRSSIDWRVRRKKTSELVLVTEHLSQGSQKFGSTDQWRSNPATVLNTII